MTLYFRNIKKKDFKPLESIIQKIWEYDTFCSPKTSKRAVKMFLSSCLAHSSFSQVAVYQDQVVGVILAKDLTCKKQNVRDLFRLASSLLPLYLTEEGRHVLTNLTKVEALDQELLAKSNKNYEAELTLFVMADGYQGKGIGKTLYQAAISYFEQQKVTNFYLFTDTKCHYQFYEYQGMKQQDKEMMSLTLTPDRSKEQIGFFLYDKELK